MRIQEKNVKDTERTGINLLKEGNLSATRPVVIILTVALGILLIVVILLVFCLIYRCRRALQTSPTSVVNIGTSLNLPTTSIPQPAKDNLGSLYDLLTAFAFKKAEKANP
jgi:hypothetical protein